MSVSKLLPAGGANDFNVAISGTHTSVILTKEYSTGSYTITSTGNDTTFDIYAYNANGSLAGYTNTPALSASIGFNKLVILGHTAGTLLSFTFKTTYTTVDTSAEVTAGPVVTSLTPSALPKIDDTFVLTGRNFASNCAITFSSTTGVYTSTQAKSIVRSSATSLIVTRPDNLPLGNSPYTITAENPGVTAPVGSNPHILANSVTAGVAPVWVTGATLSYTTGTATSFTLLATDADAGSDVDYSVVSGALPTGLSLNGETGVISGTPTTSNTTVTFRATDQGGNFVDKAILFNAAPVWTTAATLTKYEAGTSYSVQLVASDDNTAISYSLVSGATPTGTSISSGGLISGTVSGGATGTFTPTIRATDAYGATADRTFSIAASVATIVSYTDAGSFTFALPAGSTGAVQYLLVAGGGGGGDSNLAGGGGGAGGMIEGTLSLTPGSSYSVVVGNGGGGGAGNSPGTVGSNSVFATATAHGGGRGAGYGVPGGNGGSGGGGAAPDITAGGAATIGVVPAGSTGFGNNGAAGSGGGSYGNGGAGGGAGGPGYGAGGGGYSANSGGSGRNNALNGTNTTYCTGGGGASNFYSGADATNPGGGGGATGDASGGGGFRGRVVLKYLT